MAKRNELRSLFSGLNPSNPGSCKDVALCNLVFQNQIKSLAPKLDSSCRNRPPDRGRFARDINHLRATIRADMREALHQSATDCDHFAARLVIVAKIVLLRLSIDDIEEKVFEFLVAGASPKGLHDVEFEVAAETRT